LQFGTRKLGNMGQERRLKGWVGEKNLHRNADACTFAPHETICTYPPSSLLTHRVGCWCFVPNIKH